MSKKKYIVRTLTLTAFCILAAPFFIYGQGSAEGISRAAETLIGNLGDSQERVRISAAIRLSNYDDAVVVRALVKAASEDASETVRRVALRSLGEIGSYGGLDVILDSFKSGLPALRSEAVLSSVNFSTPVVTGKVAGMTEDPHPMVRQTAVEALGRAYYFDDTAAEAVLGSLTDMSEGVRVAAVRVSASRKIPGAEIILKGLLKDPAPIVRENAALALAEFSTAENVMAALRNALEDRSPMVRMNAALSLAKTGSSAGVSIAIEGISLPDARVRATACLVIGRAGSERSRVFLERALDDVDSRVRRAAVTALEEMDMRFSQ